MKKILNEWRQFLNEVWYNDAEETLEKYPNYEDDIEFFQQYSPYNEKYIGKFVKWVDSGYDRDEIVSLARHFKNNRQSMKDRGLKKLDLMQYSTPGELDDVIQQYGKKSKRQKEKEVTKKGTIKVYEDDEYLVVAPLSEESSCKYGKGTKWCTAGTGGGNAFELYFERQGITLVYILNKNLEREDRFSKIAIAYMDYVESGKNNIAEIRDVRDKLISLKDVKKALGEKSNKIISKSNEIAEKIGDKKWKEKEQKVLNGEVNDFGLIKNVLKNTKNQKVLRKFINGDFGKFNRRGERAQIQMSIAKNENATNEMFEKLLDIGGANIMVGLSGNPGAPGDILATVYKRKKEYSPSGPDSSNIKSNLVQNSNTPPEIIGEIVSEDYFSNIAKRALKSRAMPKKYFNKVIESDFRQLLILISSNPNLPTEIFEKLSRSKYQGVRQKIIHNPKIPDRILKNLANDEGVEVRVEIAKSSKTPPETLARLANDRNIDVRNYVATNDNTPVDVLAELAKDKNKFVRKNAKQALKDRNNLNESIIKIRVGYGK